MDRVLSQFDDVMSLPRPDGSVNSWIGLYPGAVAKSLIKREPAAKAKTRATQSLALLHPSISKTQRWILDDDILYIVRDYVPGQSMADAVSQQATWAFDKLRTLIDPVLDAIDYAHSCGVSHGGLKAANIIVGPENPIVTDFGQTRDINLDRIAYADSTGQPTHRSDYYSICELYKEFLPAVARDDEVRQAARTRLLRNLTEVQQSAATADELRYKLDAVHRMAQLLGFSSESPSEKTASTFTGARLVPSMSPPTAEVILGGGTTIALALENTGDTPLYVHNVAADVVWMNLHGRFEPVTLAPDTGCDLLYTVSAARLAPGTHEAHITVLSNHGLTVTRPRDGKWDEQVIRMPVIVRSASEAVSATPPGTPARIATDTQWRPPVTALPQTSGSTFPSVACMQEPDPALVIHGQNGVLHLGIRNTSNAKMRIDKISAFPTWLVYPGEFKPTTLEPNSTQYFGFSVISNVLTPGDYKASVTLVTSALLGTDLGPRTVWHDIESEIRVRVVKYTKDPLDGSQGAGCAGSVIAACSLVLAAIVWIFAK